MTKQEQRNKCKEILHSNRYADVCGDDFEYMMGVLGKHPNAKQKIGCGVKRMYVERNPVYTSTWNFNIERLDGSTTDFSYIECISPTKFLQKFKSACRAAIDYQIKEFRSVNNMDGTRHADHHPESFDSILKRFTNKYGYCGVLPTTDNSYGDELNDDDYKDMWQVFHGKEAVLRNVSATENLTKKRK